MASEMPKCCVQQARALGEAMDQALRGSVATKADITAPRNDITALESRLTIKGGYGMMGLYVLLTGTAALLFHFMH